MTPEICLVLFELRSADSQIALHSASGSVFLLMLEPFWLNILFDFLGVLQ